MTVGFLCRVSEGISCDRLAGGCGGRDAPESAGDRLAAATMTAELKAILKLSWVVPVRRVLWSVSRLLRLGTR